jgi:hypothetical protein
MPSELGPAGVAWYPGASVPAAAARLARLGRADVVHAHMSDAELAATLALPAIRAKLVVTRHFAQRRGSSPAARALGALAPYVVAEQLAISQFVAESIDGASVVVVPGVRDVDDPAPPERRRSTVLMVQRLAQEKRVEVGIEAFARSDLRRQGWSLEIAGSGPADAELRALADRLDLGESCRFLGQRFDVDALYREAGIFLATRPDEPYGLSVVEAMAHGLPVVAARGGGHSETVGRADEPALFRPGDVDDAARQLSELARDAARRASYGAELRAIQRALAPDRVGLANRVVRPLRMVKDADEVERLQRASDAADETFRRGVAAIHRGVTERELHDVMLDSFRSLGSDGLSFQGVAFGAHTAAPHHHAGDTPVTEGALWFDIGCRLQGYCSDLTRPVYVGTPDPEFVKVHQIVWEARKAGEEAARAGVVAIIQPGGSVRDADSIRMADEYGLSMVFTGMRHFKH